MVAIGFAAGTMIIALTGYTAAVERRRDRTWWFCSTHCRDEFAADPDRFLTALTA